MMVRAWWAAAAMLAMTLGGCEAPLGPPATSGDVLSGRWSGCLTDASGDYRQTFTFYPDASYLVATDRHGTTDGTCGGAMMGSSYAAWSYTLGKPVSANIGPGGTPVSARELTSRNSLVTIYSIVYEDSHATPPLLYFGDVKLDPAFDGSAATKRPNVLATAALAGI